MTTGPAEEAQQTYEAFQADLHKAAELRRAIERYEAGRDSYVAKIEARYEQWLKPLRDEYSKAIKPVLDYIRNHHEEIFAATTQVDEVDASLKRTPSTQLVFDPKDEDNIIAHLEQTGHGDLVDVTKSLKKEPIKKQPEVVETTVGLRIARFINVLLTFKPRPASDAKPRKKSPTETVQIAVD